MSAQHHVIGLACSEEPITIRAGDMRATLYLEGGVTVEAHVPGIGWVLADDAEGRTVDSIVGVLKAIRAARLPVLSLEGDAR